MVPDYEPDRFDIRSRYGSIFGTIFGILCHMVNPFQVTKPVGPSEVIGRDDESRQLVELAVEGNNARLVAPRRFGKTSLLKRVQSVLDNEGWIPVYVDLLGILSADDFTARIERAYTQQLTGGVAQWWAGLRRSLKPTASAGGGPVPASISLDLSGQSKEALAERLDLPKRVRAKTGNRVHVVFDEFQELDQLAQKNVDQVLRSVIQHHGDAASYVFSGSELHMMEMMFADPHRAFYGQAQKIPLKPLADDALAEYIVSRFEGTGKTLRAEVLDALLGLVLGHPQRAMAAAHVLWRKTDGEADLGDWEEARLTLMDDVDDELRALWMGADVSEREVLVLVAAGLSPYSRAGGRARGGNTVRAVGTLTARGLIAEGDRRPWYIVDPLFAEWARDQRGRPNGSA
jgi:uncharacterized protein